MDKTVFETHSIHCPICKTKGTYIELKSSAYVIIKREMNGYPTEIKWYEDSHSNINIHYYNYWTCKSCYYTDKVTNFFKPESSQSPFLKEYRSTVRDLNKASQNFLSLSTNRLSQEKSQTYDKALLQAYIYLYNLTSMPEKAENHYAIGDTYQKISWLLLESTTKLKDPEIKKIKRDFNQLLTDNFETYLTSFHRFEIDITTFKNEIINLLHKSVNESNKETIKEYYQHIKGFTSNLEKSILYVNTLNEKFVENTKRKTSDTKPKEKDKTFESFVSELRLSWIDVPVNEKAAIMNSNIQYRLAINLGYFGNNIQGICNLFKLIIFGYEKLGENLQLKEFLDNGLKLLYNQFKAIKSDVEQLELKRENIKKRIDTIKTDQLSSSSVLKESINELDKILQQKRTDLRTIRDYSNQFKPIRDKATKVLLREEIQLIDTILSEKNLSDENEAKRYLSTQGISESAIKNYFHKDVIQNSSEKQKSSLMGFLKGL